MFAAIKDALGTTRLEGTGRGGGGCINEGEVFKTDAGKIFLKKNSKSKAREMFDGEYKSLKAIVAAGIVKAPTPLLVVDNPAGGAVLVMEYLDMHSLNRHSGTLGSQLAKLHLLNVEVGKKCQANESYVGQTSEEDNPTYVSQYGFPVSTCCGYLAQDNSWCDDWVEFYTKKLQLQLSWIEKEYGDREARELWSHLQLKIPQYFSGIEVKPSLLHGDLWGGNAAETAECPVIFDPASFYGHHEYDLAISAMFGGFSRRFWDEYHSIIPKAPGWNNRHKLYKLFHNLNHWNHFGSGYRSGSLQLMRDLCR
ncbi:ketosamine-3-kinase-like isoform X2 [Homarus americanus]|uniref:ketosamine-3-kinase-like isoform X2 n=1 Tax=Homarus americanus TaxID=6706 RepID=UPI001C457C35|nr:ketosamine-3-kinase-like isoform X2 [Homarus americanus]